MTTKATEAKPAPPNSTAPKPPAPKNTAIALAYNWFRFHNHIFWRSPVAAFFTLALPLVMMIIFVSIFGSDPYGTAGQINISEFYVPALASFTAATATYTNLGISLTLMREEGTLKRVRGTPAAPWQFLTGTVASAVWVAFLGATILFVVGTFIADITIDYDQIGWMALFFVVGVLAFAVLGVAVSLLAKTGQAASAITNATILPLAFISNIFIPMDDPPRWMEILGGIFPLRSFAEGFRSGFDPALRDGRVADLLVVAAWGVAGLIFVLKYFQWVPKAESE